MWGALLVFIVSIISYSLGVYMGRRSRNLEFEWKCGHENCVFSASAGDMELLCVVIDEHSKIHDR